jgi:hypothetical protein
MDRGISTYNRRRANWPLSQAYKRAGGQGPDGMFLRALGERGKSAIRSIPGVPARIATALALIGAGAALSACGGSGPRQDADEPADEFPVEVTTAKFPTNQSLAEENDLELAVENIGHEQIPDLAVTICLDSCDADGSFSLRSEQPGLANPNRPVWILENDYPKLLEPGVTSKELDEEPTAGAEAAQTNTFSFGALAPGDDLEAVWRVTPVRGGTFTVNYQIAAGLTGKAKATTADGSPAEGSFVVTIQDKPPQVTVAPNGKIEEK